MELQGRDHLVQQDNGRGGNYGLRAGSWKLQRHDSGKAQNVKLRLGPTKVPRYQLFNLDEDPAEQNNVINVHPEIAKKLTQQLNEIIEDG